MQIEIKLPDDLEEGGDVLDVFVKAGETIDVGTGLIEVETDKATVEVPSSHAGKVVELRVSAGDSVPAGGTILVVEAADAPTGVTPSASKPSSTAPQPSDVDESKPAPRAPEHPPDPPAQTVSVTRKPAQPAPSPEPTSTSAPAAPPERSASPVERRTQAPAGPAVRRFAREVGIDINAVTGSGPGGRITREDVLAVVREGNQAVPAKPTSANVTKANDQASEADQQLGEPATDKWGSVQIQKMSKIRKTIASKMHESWTSVPRVTNFDDADVTSLEAMRQASKADYAESGIKLTTMPFVIKACALALKSNPLMNASIDLENEQVIFKQYVNIGIAVDTERGLVVPSLRNADHLSIPAIARGLSDIADSARSGKFGMDDLRGSTFTISNLGAIGGTYSTPIINTPEVAILLVGRSRKLPVASDNEIQVRLMMPLSLSYDHRLVDGGAAARFLNDVIGFLSTPSRLLMAP